MKTLKQIYLFFGKSRSSLAKKKAYRRLRAAGLTKRVLRVSGHVAERFWTHYIDTLFVN